MPDRGSRLLIVLVFLWVALVVGYQVYLTWTYPAGVDISGPLIPLGK